MSKTTKIVFVVTALILAASVGVSAWFAARYFNTLTAQVDTVAKQIDTVQEDLRSRVSIVQANVDSLRAAVTPQEESNETKENDVTIANEYVIHDTSKISDAFLSGDTSSLSDKEKETLDMASAVLKEVITDKMSDYDKELAVYEWMTTSLRNDSGLLPVVPTTQEDCDNPYGVLKYHNAVCVGYATTFRLFMQMLQIPCMVVHNTEAFHTWDLVQLNGHWYHTDIYSDISEIRFAHFNRNDAMQEADQTWDKDFFPKADGEEYCYALQKAAVKKDVFEVPAELREKMDKGENYISYRIPKDQADRSVLILETFLSRLQEKLQYGARPDIEGISWQWIALDKDYLLSISISPNSSDIDLSELSEEELERIDAVMDEVFGDIDLPNSETSDDPEG